MRDDERIRQTTRRIASQGFGIWYVLLLASLLYRQFYLHQSIDQYWDIAVVFFVGAFYVSTALFSRGAVYENRITKSFKWSMLTILLTIMAVSYLLGNIKSLADVAVTAVSAAIGVGLVSVLFYLLYRRWEKGIQAP